MKRLFAWIAGAAGGVAAYRAMRAPRPQAETGVDERAAELRARLEAARVAPAEDAPAGPLDAAQPDPAARRAQVHEQGRAALDEMRRDSAS